VEINGEKRMRIDQGEKKEKKRRKKEEKKRGEKKKEKHKIITIFLIPNAIYSPSK